MGYIPNLVYGKGTSDRTATRDKIWDEHNFILFAFQLLKKINNDNGIDCVVMDHSVLVKVFILFEILKDTTNGWVSILGINRESNNHIMIAIVNMMM